MTDHAEPRTYLFVPADRPDRVRKALASDADRIVVDLEDGVAESGKAQARDLLHTYTAGRDRVLVRINAVTTAHAPLDIAACQRTGLHSVMLPKADAAAVRAMTLTAPQIELVALVETAAGVLGAAETAAQPQVRRLALGAEDLAVELGIDPSDPVALGHAMSTVVLASAASGLPGPIAPVTTRLHDPELVRQDAARARTRGFRAKLLIHPAQDGPARVGLRPTAAESEWARTVLLQSDGSGGAAAAGDHMVDGPVLERARRIVRDSRG